MSHLLGNTPVVATDRNHLWGLVREIVMTQGHSCDLNHIDVSGIEDFSLMFDSLPFEGDISKWNMSNAKDLSGMFENSTFSGDLSKWDVSGVYDMSHMFARCKYNGDISAWDVSNVRSMHWMFRCNKAFQQDLSSWNTSKLEDAANMFEDCPYVQDISMWCLDALTSIDGMLEAPSLQGMPRPSLYHWYALLEEPDSAKGHFLEAQLVEHRNSLVYILHGLGLSRMQAAHWMQRQWNERHTPAQFPIDLPCLGT